jgi:hypothetical protein
MLISKAKRRKDEKIVHNPYMGAGTSDNRGNECSNIMGIYTKNIGSSLF